MKTPSSELNPVLILEEAIESMDYFITQTLDQIAKAKEAVDEAYKKRACLVQMLTIHSKQPGEGKITC